VTVAALYVDPKGVYADLPDVEVWDEARDARTYAGPWPVVAHPPCARWSRLAAFTEARFGYKRGEDGGCFAAALAAVQTYGGILEHPAHTDAWDAFDLPKPTTWSGWTTSLLVPGATAYVEQGRYGLPVKKATWLYAVGVTLPDLKWGHVADVQGPGVRGPWGGIDGWRDSWATSRQDTSRTPEPFRDVLLEAARSLT
jgi:hypothetical protein